MTILLKVVLSSLSVGGLAGGSYLATNLMRKTEEKSIQESINKDNKMEENSIKTEYIWKGGFKSNSGKSCEIVKVGEEQENPLEKEKCEELMKSNWGEEKVSQPYLWIRTDKEGAQERLKKHWFFEGSSTTKFEIGREWDVGGLVKCNSKIDAKNSKKVIVECNYVIPLGEHNLPHLKARQIIK